MLPGGLSRHARRRKDRVRVKGSFRHRTVSAVAYKPLRSIGKIDENVAQLRNVFLAWLCFNAAAPERDRVGHVRSAFAFLA
jgi:hypothetical protein